MDIPHAYSLHNIADRIPHPQTGNPVYSRIPATLRAALNTNAQKRSLNTCGCEVRFRLRGPEARITIRVEEVLIRNHIGGLAQILFGDFSSTYFPVDDSRPTIITITPPEREPLAQAARERTFAPELVRVLLPTHASVSDIIVEGDIALPASGDIPSRRLLTFGSSITQGSGSLTSRESWAGITAQRLGMDHINLGFGGGCHCEPEMADYLASRDDWDVATLETGVNMLAHDPQMADHRIVELITKVARAHTDKWIFCVGVFHCKNDIITGFNGRARAIHELVKRTVEQLALPRLRFIDGAEALHHSHDMTVDLTHPSPAGMISIGTWAARHMAEQIASC